MRLEPPKKRRPTPASPYQGLIFAMERAAPLAT